MACSRSCGFRAAIAQRRSEKHRARPETGMFRTGARGRFDGLGFSRARILAAILVRWIGDGSGYSRDLFRDRIEPS